MRYNETNICHIFDKKVMLKAAKEKLVITTATLDLTIEYIKKSVHRNISLIKCLSYMIELKNINWKTYNRHEILIGRRFSTIIIRQLSHV